MKTIKILLCCTLVAVIMFCFGYNGVESKAAASTDAKELKKMDRVGHVKDHSYCSSSNDEAHHIIRCCTTGTYCWFSAYPVTQVALISGPCCGELFYRYRAVDSGNNIDTVYTPTAMSLDPSTWNN